MWDMVGLYTDRRSLVDSVSLMSVVKS